MSMNRVQKIAWGFVISISAAFVVSLAAVGILYSHAGMPRALIGFSFMGLTGLGGLAPLVIKKEEGPVVVDERDRLFHRRAAIAGFATAYMVMGAACMIPFFVLGPGASISVAWLPMTFMAAGISHYFVYAVAILNQYGWTNATKEANHE
jgi:hypothetical protein